MKEMYVKAIVEIEEFEKEDIVTYSPGCKTGQLPNHKDCPNDKAPTSNANTNDYYVPSLLG